MAEKRPQEEKNDKEQESKKKQESHTDKLKKGIASRVKEFLSTEEGKKSLTRGKSGFISAFLNAWKIDDEETLNAYKEFLGKKVNEELSLSDFSDISINYEDTFQTYVESAEKEQFTELQEKSVTQAFIDAMDKEIQGKHFEQNHRDLWKQSVVALRDKIKDRSTLDVQLKKFFASIVGLTDAQKKRLRGVSIELRDVASHMTEKEGFDKEMVEKLNKKNIIAANTDAEDMVKKFLRAFTATEVAPAYESYEKGMKEISAIYKVPGFSRVLSSYDISLDALLKKDKSFADIYNNPDSSADKKFLAQQKAIVNTIAEKDKDFSVLLALLFANDFNLAKLDNAAQQLYVSRFRDMWKESEEMKTFDVLFEKMGVDVSDRTGLMNQIFDLSRNTLEVKGGDGEVHTISLEKKIIDRSWKADSMSETLAHALPVSFVLTPNQSIEDAYAKRLAKVEGKQFMLKDPAGKDIEIHPGNTVKITTADGKTHLGYVYKDPAGNILLRKQPGSEDYDVLTDTQMKTATAQLVAPTYAIDVDAIPTLLSHLMLLKETAARTPEENKTAMEERNNDIAKETLKETFEDPSKKAAREEIVSIAWEDKTQVDAIDETSKVAYLEYIHDRVHAINGRLAKVEKNVKDQDALIQKLQTSIKIEGAKKDVDQKQLDRLEANLIEATNKRDDLIDEANDMRAEADYLKNAQKKLNEKKKETAIAPQSTEEQQDVLNEKLDPEQQFMRDWAELNGDKTLTVPVPGKSCIMAVLPDATSVTPGGGGAWIRGDVIGFDPKTNTMQIKWHGVEGALEGSRGDMEGTISTVIGSEGLQELKRALNKVYKFKKYGSIGQWGTDLKGGVQASEDFPSGAESHFHFDKRYEGWWKHLKDDIDFPSMKQQRTGHDIKYFGKKGGDSRAWFAVETHGDAVSVREVSVDPKGKEVKSSFKKNMPANDFMMFAMEKDLRGYTQEEVDTANEGEKGLPYVADWVNVVKQPDDRYGRGVLNMRWGSIAGVMSSWDIVKKGVKNYFDDKAKKGKSAVENAMFASGWYKSLMKMPILGEAFDDIRGGFESKKDGEKKKKIGEYKDEIDQKKAPDSNGASRFILEGLSDPSVARKDPLKAAGYYLYAIQEGGNPYFRALKEKQGTGWWVEKILGPSYVPQYKAYIANIENELKKDPTNDELKTALYKDELGFMVNVWKADEAQLKPLYGSWFFTGGLGQAYNLWYNGAGINKTYEGDDKHKGFGELHGDSWPGFFEGFRVNDFIAYSKLLSEKVGRSDTNYYKWAGFVLMPFMNGQSRKFMNSSYQYQMVQIAKKAAFPFAGYMMEGNGMEKMQELFDLVSDGELTKSIEAASADEKNAKLPDITKRTKGFQKWWEKYGPAAIDALQNPKQLFTMKKELEGKLSDQKNVNKYNTLNDYINHKYNDEDRNNVSDTYGGDSIIYQKNIFSAPSGFVKEQMLNFANAQFKGKAEKNGPELWGALKNKLKDIQNIPEDQMSKDFIVFLIKRYLSMFHSRYTSTSAKKTFIAALKYPNIPMVLQLNVRGVFDRKMMGDDLPGEVTDTLIIFEQLFAKYSGVLRDNPEVVGEIFDDPRMTDYYIAASSKDTVTMANNQKNEFNRKKKLIEQGVYDDEDEYLLPWAA